MLFDPHVLMSLLDREFQQLADRTSNLESQRELNRDYALEVNDRPRRLLSVYSRPALFHHNTGVNA